MEKYIAASFQFIIMLTVSCTGSEKRSNNNYVISKGNYNKSGYETGWWQYYYNTNKRLLEEGKFVNGVRTGKWKYYEPFNDSINWNTFSNTSGNIRTNIPNFLTLVEETENIINFRSNDSNYLFNLVIGKGYATDTTNLELYRKMIYDDLSNRNITISDTITNYIETSQGNKYLFSFVSGVSKEEQRFSLFNIAGRINEQLIEVSLRCETKYIDKAKKVFFSVLPNLFIDSIRFIHSKDIIITFGKDSKQNDGY